ncbi:MAG: MerR family transcriptional regulator [Bacilli bacterium]
MYKIGDFSSMSKTTIKALRYYEKEGLLKPVYIDQNTGYRYYETSQLVEISKIISLRQIGLSIKDIKNILNGCDMKSILTKRKKEIKENLTIYTTQLSNINYLLEENNMKNEIFIKEIPSYIIYYSDGIISDFSKIPEFVLQAGAESAKANPNLKCITPNYCYVSYLDGEYKEKDIKIRYAEAVEEFGEETNQIKFMKTTPVTAVCIYHKGSYENLRQSYNIILKYIEDNGYEIVDNVRECYIDGCWNKDNSDDYLTEIEFPVKKIIKDKSN